MRRASTARRRVPAKAKIRLHFVRRQSAKLLRALSDLLLSVDMRARPARLMARAIRGSRTVIVAFRGPRLVGFGRMISDGVYYGTLWDIAVSPERQGRGIGTAIVKRLLREARRQGLVMVGLFTNLRNRAFYERLGFRLLHKIHPMTTSRLRAHRLQRKPSQ